MEKTQVLTLLSKCKKSGLLNFLSTAYDQMDFDQRQAVFGSLIHQTPPAEVNAEQLPHEVEAFYRASLAGEHFAPFAMNSKNFMHVPDKTRAWFASLGHLLQCSSQLVVQNDYARAVVCFGSLYELVDAMERGQDIVFADEYGSWMIPGDEEQYLAAYMTALAATSSPADFTAKALPLIQRDDFQSFTTQAYASAMNAANEVQRAYLTAEIQQKQIRTAPSMPG